MRITFMWQSRGQDWQRTRARLDPLLFAGMEVNLAYLSENPYTPALYESGVKYRVEPLRPSPREHWQDIETTILRGHGDCEDLAMWRAAELRRRGVMARPVCILSGDMPGMRIIHAVVALPDGSIEDPSKRVRQIESQEVG